MRLPPARHADAPLVYRRRRDTLRLGVLPPWDALLAYYADANLGLGRHDLAGLFLFTPRRHRGYVELVANVRGVTG